MLSNEIHEREHSINGRIGIATISDCGHIWAYRGHESFPSASLIKVSLAWQWLAGSTQGSHRIQASDISDPEGSLAHQIGQIQPKQDIARRMITESENSATNLVLTWVGGIEQANRWLHARGWGATRWERIMLDWQARERGFDNITTAWSCVQQLWHLKRSSSKAAQQLLAWMTDSINDHKLERVLEPGMQLAHKVGDLPSGIEHDMGIIEWPNGRWLAICILSEGQQPAETLRNSVAELAQQRTKNLGLA